MPKNLKSPSVNEQEVAKFSAIADEWWDENGKFKPLHKFNPTRIKYIKEKLIEHFNLDDKSKTPLEGLNILDVGCGGGLLSVPISRLGAQMTSIDASEANIKTAKTHAKNKDINNIDYFHTTAENLSSANAKFDAILNMEVIEHVEDVESFMSACSKMLKPNGLIFVATMNRTLKSYASAIIGAEYILRWLPIGTHDWKKFLKPSEINKYFEAGNITLTDSTGVKYNILKDEFTLTDSLDINYILLGKKEK